MYVHTYVQAYSEGPSAIVQCIRMRRGWGGGGVWDNASSSVCRCNDQGLQLPFSVPLWQLLVFASCVTLHVQTVTSCCVVVICA